MTPPSSTVVKPDDRYQADTHEIDLLALFGSLLERKAFIIGITLLFSMFGILYALFSTPIYQATAMIQVEEKGGAVPGFDDMSGLFEQTSAAVTEIELLKSRTVIGEAVDNLKLDIEVAPKLFPFIGQRFYRNYKRSAEAPFAEPLLGANSFAWGGEILEIHKLEAPEYLLEKNLILVVKENSEYELKSDDGEILLSGKEGENTESFGVSLTVKAIKARAGTEFIIINRSRLNKIIELQQTISASEKGKDSGIINLSFQDANHQLAENVLNEIASIYVRQNVDRNSAEAQKSLEFLKVHLPDVKRQLESAEQRLNEYQVKQQSVDISLETQAILQQVVELDTKLQELELEQLELGRRFKKEHPSFKGLSQQITAVKEQKRKLTAQVSGLPETQQELLRLTRDVEVNNEIYTLLLAKTQELDIVRAGTIGNVRIIDTAEVNTSKPVKPKKALIVVMATTLGGMLAIVIVLVQKALFKAVEDPKDIEAIGIPVYASVPFSDYQSKLTGMAKLKSKKMPRKPVLAIENPTDLTIESLRSLRTSLHFAMMEAKNNVIAISGPSPNIGKSFISGNLSVILAQSNKKVLLVDADMRKGHIHKDFGLKADDGLSDYLSGKADLNALINTTLVDNLSVLTRGQVPPNPSELLMHENFSRFIEQVSSTFDLVIVDTPPLLAVTDAAIVAAQTGTTLLIARFGQNQIREIELTRSRFEQNGTEIKGVVFNGVQRKAHGYYGYYGYYNYEYRSD